VVGEQHDVAWHHEIQAQVLREVAERVDSAALGMEMFQRPFQSPLDAYIAGEISEADMLEQTEWAQRWGFGTDQYRPMWRFAHENEIPVVAHNARRELSKAIANGFSAKTGVPRLPNSSTYGSRTPTGVASNATSQVGRSPGSSTTTPSVR
jgi:uncharacterized iron-regulated protein